MLAAASNVEAQRPDVMRLRDSVDAHAPAWLATWKLASLAVAFVTDDGVQWTRVFGEQRPGVRADEHTVYNVASLTKPVFAEMVLRLAAAGRVELDRPLATASPPWVDPDVLHDPRHRALTLRLLLSHRGGFPNWRRETRDTLRFIHDPGTRYGYSGEGYEYAARFVERRMAASLDEIARRFVFEPFGMVDASFTERPSFSERAAWPQGADGRMRPPTFAVRANAADLLFATIGDYGRFLAGVMRRTGLDDSFARQRDSVQVEDPGALAACRPAVSPRCPSAAGYGLGWAIMRYAQDRGAPPETVRWHTGSDDGAKGMVVYLPERRVGIVMLATGDQGFQAMIDAGVLLLGDSPFVGYLRSGRR